MDGKEEEYTGGNKGEGDKGCHQLGFEAGTEDIVLFFIVELGQISENQQNQGQQQ